MFQVSTTKPSAWLSGATETYGGFASLWVLRELSGLVSQQLRCGVAGTEPLKTLLVARLLEGEEAN